MNTYAVGVRWETLRVKIEAKNATEAKRKYCRMTGRRYSDPWCGASVLVAEREVKRG